MYDVVIIGGGPAGLSAAIYLARQKLSFAMLTATVGGYALWSQDVENYLGFHFINGVELVKKFQEHLKDYEGHFELREGEPVERVEKIENGFRVTTAKAPYDAKALLITSGAKHRELGVPGEREFAGRGVTYCATCDAPVFKNKKVFIIGGGNSAMDAALFLEKYTTGIVMVNNSPALGGDAVMHERVLASKKITVHNSTKVVSIIGDTLVRGIVFTGSDGNQQTELADGVFIEIGLQPAAQFIDFVEKDGRGQIVVDKLNRTSVEGIFAAGDVTDVMFKQISVAVGEGSKAALQIIAWLNTRR